MSYWWARLCNKLVDNHLQSWEWTTLIPIVSVWPLTYLSVHQKSCPANLKKMNSLHFLNSRRGHFRGELLLREWNSWKFTTWPHSHPNKPKIVWWSSVDLPDHVVDGFRIRDCLWRHGKEVIHCRVFILLTSEVLSWIVLSLLQVVSHKLLYLEEQACNTRAHHQIPLRLVLSCASNFPAARPSNRQGMHPSISIETLKLRRMNLRQIFLQLVLQTAKVCIL